MQATAQTEIISFVMMHAGEIFAIGVGLIGIMVASWRANLSFQKEVRQQYVSFVRQQSEDLKATEDTLEKTEGQFALVRKTIQQQVLQLERGRNEADRLIEANQTLQADLQRQQRTFATELEALQLRHMHRMTEVDEQISAQKADLSKLREEVASTRKQYRNEERKAKTLRLMANAQERQVENLRRANKVLNGEVQRQKALAASLIQERNMLSQRVQDLERDSKSQLRELKALRGVTREVDALRTAVTQLQQKNGDTQS